MTVDAVHRAGRARRQRLRRRAGHGVFRGLALLVDRPHEGNRLPIGIGRDVFDAHVRVGVPVDGVARHGLLSRPPDVHDQRRRGLGVRLIFGVLANRARALAMPERGRVAGATDLERRPQLGLRGRNGPREIAVDDVHELTDAGQLGVHQRPPALADMTLHAGDFGVRRVLPRRVLRVHLRVARLAAELRRLHVVQRPLRREQHQSGIDDGQGHDANQGRAHARPAQVNDRPVDRRRGVATQRPALQPDAQRNQQQAEHEHCRHRDEDHQSGVRVGEQSEQVGGEQRQERHRAHRRNDDAGERDGMPSRGAAGHRYLLQADHVGDERVEIRRRQLGVTIGHRRLLGRIGFLFHVFWRDDPRADVVSAQLLADPVERTRLATGSGDGVAHRTLLCVRTRPCPSRRRPGPGPDAP